MSYKFKTLLFFLVTLSCGFVQESSISKAVALIKECVENRQLATITIVNSHNGRYTITSTVWTGPDSVRLVSFITDMAGGRRDTTFMMEKKNFLFRLNRAAYPINSIVLAGHHQAISVKRYGVETKFETTDGRTLMDLLEYGE